MIWLRISGLGDELYVIRGGNLGHANQGVRYTAGPPARYYDPVGSVSTGPGAPGSGAVERQHHQEVRECPALDRRSGSGSENFIRAGQDVPGILEAVAEGATIGGGAGGGSKYTPK